jgi:hypothetical protein
MKEANNLRLDSASSPRIVFGGSRPADRSDCFWAVRCGVVAPGQKNRL